MKIGTVVYDSEKSALNVEFLPENVSEATLLGAAAGALDFHGEAPEAAAELIKTVAVSLGFTLPKVG